jgi:NAD+ kinase
MKTIGLIVNFKKEQAVESVKHVASLAAGMGFTVLSETRAAALCPTLHECPVASFAQRGAEAVVVLGGDGTMLDASHQLAGQRLPMMGLNIGSLGYLTSVEAHQFADALQQLREDRCGVSLRSGFFTKRGRASPCLTRSTMWWRTMARPRMRLKWNCC